MKEKIDIEIISALLLEINDKVKLILTMIPAADRDHTLKHLSASSIHLTFFARDIFNQEIGGLDDEDNTLLEFFAKCGCKGIRECD